MIQKNSNQYYTSSLLTIPGVIHGYSTRLGGDMRQEGARKKFLQSLSVADASLVLSKQVHGALIATIGPRDPGREVAEADGVVYCQMEGRQRPVLGIRVADCVPILAVDPAHQVIGVAHAGWRGTVEGISRRLIEAMVDEGASIKNILISIGPRIGMCCYDVPDERAQRFLDLFNDNHKVASQSGSKWHVDIGYANFLQLTASGILLEHIDIQPICTACQSNEFFSYRKDTKESFGETLGVIGFH